MPHDSTIPDDIDAGVRLDVIFEALDRSDFRRRQKLNKADRRYLRTKGLALVMRHAAEFIEQRLAPAVPARDGMQTPMRGHPVFTAQHATATCCRRCLASWHRIPAGRALSPGETGYVLAVLRRWLETEQAKDRPPDDPAQLLMDM